MSVTIEQSGRTRSRGKGGRRETRRSRDLSATGPEAAEQRRARAQERTREQARILDLLRRGAGVSQILRDIAQPKDRLHASVGRANHLAPDTRHGGRRLQRGRRGTHRRP
jgi:hypothetical protein